MAAGEKNKFGASTFEPETFWSKCSVLKKVFVTLLWLFGNHVVFQRPIMTGRPGNCVPHVMTLIKVVLWTACIENGKLKINKIWSGCQYVGYLYLELKLKTGRTKPLTGPRFGHCCSKRRWRGLEINSLKLTISFARKMMQKLFLVGFRNSLFCVSVILQPQNSHNAALFFLFKSSFGPRFEFEARGLWPICEIKKTLTLDCFSAKVWASRHIKRTLPLFTLKLYKNKNIRCPFKVTADTTDKSNTVFVAR